MPKVKPYFRFRAAPALVVAFAVLAAAPTWKLDAEDAHNLKPLPKFLRTPVTADRYLSTRDIDEVMEFERVEPVCLQLIKRPGVPAEVRAQALHKLAELRATDAVVELLPWIEHWDRAESTETAARPGADASRRAEQQRQEVLVDLARLLPAQARAALERQRAELVKFASDGRRDATRRAALAAIIQADGSVDAAWQFAAEHDRLLDLLHGLAWLPDDAPRDAIYARVRPLLDHDSDAEVRRAAIEAVGQLDVAPSEVFQRLTQFVTEDHLVDACVASISRIASEHWTEELRRPLADALLRHLNNLPLADRTEPPAQQTIALVRRLAGLMPPDQAAEVGRELEAASVRQIHVRALHEQMAYDQTVLVVQTGQAVQIVFENTDIMPHNLVLVDSPAAREEVGIAADRMQNQPDALARGYLPDSPHVLHATRMLQPGQSEALTFVAPNAPGTYAYLCTYPGHWIKMYGALVVVEDTAAYLAANDPLPAADALLGIKTVAWTYEQLAAELPRLTSGRSFENGQRAFLKASCYACHQVQQQGGRIGPDLTLIRDKLKTPEELLRHILLPSEAVEEKYATVIIETDEGQVIRGVLVGEDESQVQISEDPLASCAPRVIPKDQIADLTRSRLSPMPEQLLNTLTRTDDVLDLLAYLMSGGDRQAPMFQ